MSLINCSHNNGCFYSFPDATYSIEDYYKLKNYDLPKMNISDMKGEAFRINLALAYVDKSIWLFIEPENYLSAFMWLKSRLSAIKEEMRKRRCADNDQ